MTGTVYRRIEQHEVGAATAFAIEGMKPELYPMHLDREKVRATIQTFIEPSRDHFQMAAFDGDRIVGGISAVVVPLLFFERHEAHVVMCRATKPGAGLRLLHELRAWADADMRIRRVVWAMEFHADPRMVKLAQRAWFTNTLTVCTYYK